MPFGDLEVYLEGAIGIKDTAFKLFGKGSPYCILTCGSQMVQTEPVREGGSRPFWGKSFNFKIDRSTEDLNIKILNKNCTRDDDVLGETTLSFRTVFHGGHSLPVTAYPVRRPSGRVHGEVILRLHFFAKVRPKDYKERPQCVANVPPQMQPRPLQPPPAIGRVRQYAPQADDKEGFNSDSSRSLDSYGGHPANINRKKVVSFRSVDDNASDEGSGRHHSDQGGYGGQRSRFVEQQDVDPYGPGEPYDAEYQNVPPRGGPHPGQQPMPPPPGEMDGPGRRQPYPQRQGPQQPVRTARPPPQNAPPGQQQQYAAPSQVPQQPTRQRSREQNSPIEGHVVPMWPPGPLFEQQYKYEEASFGTQGRRSNPPGQQPRRASFSSLPGSAPHSPSPAYDERAVDQPQECVRQTSDVRFEGPPSRAGSRLRSPTPSLGEAQPEAPRALPPQQKVAESELPRPPGSRNIRRAGPEERSLSPSVDELRVEPPGASLHEEACEATGRPRFLADLLTKSGSGTSLSPSYDAPAGGYSFAEPYLSSPPAISSETAASPNEILVAAKVFNPVVPNSSLPFPPGKTSWQEGHQGKRVPQPEIEQVMSVPAKISESIFDFPPAQQSPQIGEDTGPLYKSFRNRQPEQQQQQRRDWEQEQPCQQAPPYSQRPAPVEDDSDADSQGSLPSRISIKSSSSYESKVCKASKKHQWSGKNREQLRQQQPQQAPPHLQPPAHGDVDDDSDGDSQGSLPSRVSQKSMSSHNSRVSKLSKHSQRSGSGEHSPKEVDNASETLSASGSGRDFTHPSVHGLESSQLLNTASRQGASTTPTRPENFDQPSVQVRDGPQPWDATSPATPQAVGPGSFNQPPGLSPRPPQHLNVGSQRPPAHQREDLNQFPELGRGGPQFMNTGNQGGLYMDQPQPWQETGGPQPHNAGDLGTQVRPPGKKLIQLPAQGRGGLCPLLKPGSQGPLPVSPVGPPNQPTMRGPGQSRQNQFKRPMEYQPAQPSGQGGGGLQSDRGPPAARPMAEQLVRQDRGDFQNLPTGSEAPFPAFPVAEDILQQCQGGPRNFPRGTLGTSPSAGDDNFQPVGQGRGDPQTWTLSQQSPLQGLPEGNFPQNEMQDYLTSDGPEQPPASVVGRNIPQPQNLKRGQRGPVRCPPGHTITQTRMQIPPDHLMYQDPLHPPGDVVDRNFTQPAGQGSLPTLPSQPLGQNVQRPYLNPVLMPSQGAAQDSDNKRLLGQMVGIDAMGHASLQVRRGVPPPLNPRNPPAPTSDSSPAESGQSIKKSSLQRDLDSDTDSQSSKESRRLKKSHSSGVSYTSNGSTWSIAPLPLNSKFPPVEAEEQGSISENENPGSAQKCDNNDYVKNSDGGRSGQEEEDGIRSFSVGVTVQGEAQGSEEEEDGSEKAASDQDIGEDKEFENEDYQEGQFERHTGGVSGHEYYDGIVTQAVGNCDDSNGQLEEDDFGETGGPEVATNLVESSEQSCTVALSTYSGAETATIYKQTCSVDVAIESRYTVDYEGDPVGGDQLSEVCADPNSYDVGEEDQVSYAEYDEAYNVEDTDAQYGTDGYDYGQQGDERGWVEGRDDDQFYEANEEPEEKEYEGDDAEQEGARISSQQRATISGAAASRGRPQRNSNGQRRTSQPPQLGQGPDPNSRYLISGHPIVVTPDPSAVQFHQDYSDLSPPRYISPQIGPGPTPYCPPQYAHNDSNHGSDEPHARLQNWLQTSADGLPPDPGPPVHVPPPSRPPPPQQVQSYSAGRTTETREVNHSYRSSDDHPSYKNVLLQHQHQNSQIPTYNSNADMLNTYYPTPRVQPTKLNDRVKEFYGSAYKKVSSYVGPILAAEVTKSVLGVDINDQNSNGGFIDGADIYNQGGDPSYVISTQDDGIGLQGYYPGQDAATNLDTTAINVMTSALNAYAHPANQGPRPPGNMMRGAPMQRPMRGMPPGMRGRGPMGRGPPRLPPLQVQGGYRPMPGAPPRRPPNQQMGS